MSTTRVEEILDVKKAKRHRKGTCRGCQGRYGALSTVEKREEVHEFCRFNVYGKNQSNGPAAIGHSSVTE